MDLNDLCMTLVLVNSIWLITMRPARAWTAKLVVALALLGGAWWWKPESAGLIAIGPWAILVMLPIWLQHWTFRLVQQRHLELAKYTSTVLAVLHPTVSAQPLRVMIRVLISFNRGEVAAGLQLAEQLGLYDSGLRNLGLVTDSQMTGNWADFELQLALRHSTGLDDPSLLTGKIQSVTEREAWDELNRVYAIVGRARFSPEQDAALFLRAFAVLGDVITVQKLLQCSSHLISPNNREFWLAVAEQVSGAVDRAQARLLKLLPRSSAALRPMIERRLTAPAVGPSDRTVSNRALQELSGVRSIIDHEARYAVLSGGTSRWPVMTIALILVMLAVFLKEIPGGSEDTRNLEELGALVVPLTGEPGEWKRVFTSGFLHFGPLHLTCNIVGLLILGRLVERAWGPVRMLGVFLLSVVVSGSLLPWFTIHQAELSEEVRLISELTRFYDRLAFSGGPLPWLSINPLGESTLFAGASGGIMGFLGGLWGHLAVGRVRFDTPLVHRQFRASSTLIVMQSLCDIMTAQVSMTCHLLGLFTGMFCGIAVGLCRIPRNDSRPV